MVSCRAPVARESRSYHNHICTFTLSRSVYLGNYYEYTRDFNSRSISLIQFAPCALVYKAYLLAQKNGGDGGASVTLLE